MKIFTVGQNGDLTRHKGKSIVVEFDDGEILELAESEKPLPPEILDGLHIWAGGIPSQAHANINFSQLNITPLAANGIIIVPSRKKMERPMGMTMSVYDDDCHQHQVKEKKFIIELNNGKTLEVMEDYSKKGLLVWGGREPILGLPLEKLKERAESLGLYLMGCNIVHIFPYKLE